jgi:hypothetical protein
MDRVGPCIRKVLQEDERPVAGEHHDVEAGHDELRESPQAEEVYHRGHAVRAERIERYRRDTLRPARRVPRCG